MEETEVEAARLINDLSEINFGTIALIIAGTGLMIYAASRLLPFLAKHSPSRIRLLLLGAFPVVRLLLLTVAVLWLVPTIFNITLQNLLFIAGALGVAIGFVFKDLLSNVVAGIVAVFERPYRPGDWIAVDADYGEVIKVGMRALQLRTPSDDVVTVPHDKIWKTNVANANNGAQTLMCVVSFWVMPDHDAARLRELLRDVALTSAYLAYDKPVLVIVSQRAWGTHYELKAYPFDMRDQFQFMSELTVRGKQAICDAGARETSVPAAVAFDSPTPVSRRGAND